MKDAEAQAIKKVDDEVKARVLKILEGTQGQLVTNAVITLTPQVENRVSAVIDAQCSDVARINKSYVIKADNDQWFLSDDTLARKDITPDAGGAVYTTQNRRAASWQLVAKP